MFILYDLIFLVFAIVYLPIYLCKRKFHRGFSMRLGILPYGLELNRPIWIHAVSVGEIIAAGKLIAELRTIYPNKRFLITTVTPTGNKIAKGFASSVDFVAYLPLDFSFIIRSVVNRIKPALFIIMETEIWPNLIRYLRQRNIPIILVNGRISDRSFRGYRMIKFLLKPLLSKISLFCAQTRVDADRFLRLGVPEERVKITGNMKFDVQIGSKETCLTVGKDYTDHKLKLGLKQKERLLVAGSTHAGEEEIILGVYKNLLKEFPCLRLLIAPRHPERAKEIARIICGFGLSAVFVCELPAAPETSKPVFILDTIGQLMDFYNLAEVVFVGGSLIKKGGHNILEPASLGKPVIFGPHMFNFRDIAGLFLENKAAVLVHNREELEAGLRGLFNNPSRITELSQRAQALILENRGATERNLGYIRRYL